MTALQIEFNSNAMALDTVVLGCVWVTSGNVPTLKIREAESPNRVITLAS